MGSSEETNMAFGYTDVPVEDAEHDYLGVVHHVHALAEFIMECETPMTIAIQGDWGSGKTSMMNMIKQQLDDRALVVWFNTWQFSQFEMGDDLSRILVEALLEELKPDEALRKKLRIPFNLVKAAGSGAVSMVLEKVAGGTAAETVKSAVSEMFQGPRDMAKQLAELKKSMQEAVRARLTESKKDRLVVFVDDLDRLPPERAVELLEVMKLFLDLEKCVFVLAVDYAVVTQGIKAKYGDYIDEAKGKSFFDKLIQLPFIVPVNQYKLDQYLSKLLSKMKVIKSDDDVGVYQNLVENSVGSNPRGLKRVLNAFLLLHKVASKQQILPDNPVVSSRVIFAVLCLQTAYEKLYEYLLTNLSRVNVKLLSTLQDPDKIRKDKKLLKELSLGDEESSEKAISRLSDFMQSLVEAIQLDDDHAVSPDELQFLKKALSFSSVVSSHDAADKQRTSDDFLNACPDDKTKAYYRNLFEFVDQSDLDLVHGTQGFSINKTVRCYPPRSKRGIEIDSTKLNESAKAFLQTCNLAQQSDKKWIRTHPEAFTVDNMKELLKRIPATQPTAAHKSPATPG